MTHDVYREWQKLCGEYEKARDAHFQAFAAINQKFGEIAKGTSGINPTSDELSEFEITWQAWESVKKRMDIFVKRYA